MTRAESLALLHLWRRAQDARSVTSMRALYPSLRGPEALDATVHGANAVRAIRDAARHAASAEARPGTYASVAYRQIAKDQARLAFRAVLDAVGLGREL